MNVISPLTTRTTAFEAAKQTLLTGAISSFSAFALTEWHGVDLEQHTKLNARTAFVFSICVIGTGHLLGKSSTLFYPKIERNAEMTGALLGFFLVSNVVGTSFIFVYNLAVSQIFYCFFETAITSLREPQAGMGDRTLV